MSDVSQENTESSKNTTLTDRIDNEVIELGNQVIQELERIKELKISDSNLQSQIEKLFSLSLDLLKIAKKKISENSSLKRQLERREAQLAGYKKEVAQQGKEFINDFRMTVTKLENTIKDQEQEISKLLQQLADTQAATHITEKQLKEMQGPGENIISCSRLTMS